MSRSLLITGRLLTRNWMLNFLGQVLALLVALPSIPFVVRILGTERFGILSIAWVLLGYFGLFDLGLGRATTKYTAECLGREDHHRLSAWVWTSLWSQVALGMAGTLITACLIPALVRHVLKVPPELMRETQISFLLLTVALPLVLASNSLRGVLEAGQHFDVVNYVKVPANISLFVVPALGLAMGFGLVGIVAMLVVTRLGTTFIYLLYCLRLYPSLRHELSVDLRILRPLLSYGGWITVSAVLGPLLAYLDRFIIGSTMSMSAVGYYSVPSEAITRVSIIPGSLTATIFPAFSSLEAVGSPARIEELCIRSLKALLLILGPLTVVIMAFGQEILRLWMGTEFATRGGPVLQILAIGVLANSLALVPFSMLQAMGRADLTAKFHLLEFPVYIGLLWLLIARMGTNGAAFASTLRASCDAALLFGAALHFRWFSIRALYDFRILTTATMTCGFGVLLFAPRLLLHSPRVQVLFALLLLFVFALAGWTYLLDGKDKSLVSSILAQHHSWLPTPK